jgi:uracil-DNA glycosylase
MDLKIEKSWHEALRGEIAKPYITELKKFLLQEKQAGKIIYPPEDLVFHAFYQTPFDKVKVVVVGQDPYHGPSQAQGLCFSVPENVPLPPSLKNIYKELVDDVKIPYPPHGCLISWVQQGVLLLNATLTVRDGEPKSHYGRGWERFTDAVIQCICERKDPIVFILWGKSAEEKCRHILGNKTSSHALLVAAHPSPLSAHAGFFGCRHFSKTNNYLTSWGKNPINWEIKK